MGLRIVDIVYAIYDIRLYLLEKMSEFKVFLTRDQVIYNIMSIYYYNWLTGHFQIDSPCAVSLEERLLTWIALFLLRYWISTMIQTVRKSRCHPYSARISSAVRKRKLDLSNNSQIYKV